MRIINPYEGVDFSSAIRQVSFTHEHTYNLQRNERAYLRGVQVFASMHYGPCGPRYPLSSFLYEYQDWNYYDVSYMFPDRGTDGTDVYTPVAARKKVQDKDNVRQQGLIVAFKVSSSEYSYTKLLADPSGLDWASLCENEDNWLTLTEEEKEASLALCTRTYSGEIPTFTDSNGNPVDTDDIPQIQNSSEHALWPISGGSGFVAHFNVLGATFAEPVWGVGVGKEFRLSHPIYESDDISQIFLNPENQQYGKIFGTINHPTGGIGSVEKMLGFAPEVFKAVEVYNVGYDKATNDGLLDTYDLALSRGHHLFCVAVVDWDNYVMDERAKFARGYNVLLLGDGYEQLPANCFVKKSDDGYVYSKSEACLDAYIAGNFYATGRGVHYITGLSISGETVEITFDAQATTIRAVTNLGKSESSGASFSFVIPPGATYLRFEAYFDDKPEGFDEMTEEEQEVYAKQGVMDFIFTNPIWIEDNPEASMEAQNTLLLF